MAYIYFADIYCDDCGDAIKKQLEQEGKTPECPEDERSFDSDEYPKWCDDESESDCPQHCGSHADCLNAEVMPSGHKIGCLLGTSLTDEGIEYVRQAVIEGGEVAEYWRQQFSWIGFDDDEIEEQY